MTLTKVARVLVLPHTVGVQYIQAEEEEEEEEAEEEAVKLIERVNTIGGLARGVLTFTS